LLIKLSELAKPLLNLISYATSLENTKSITYICGALGFPENIGRLKGNQV